MSSAKGHQAIDESVPGVRSGGRVASVAEPVKIEVIDPATGSVVARVLGGGTKEALRAVDLAAAALAGWASTPAAARAALLQQVASALREQTEQLAWLVSVETGKRIAEARAEVGFSADFFDWFAHEAAGLSGQIWNSRPGTTHYVTSHPLGVVAVLTPWNFPLSIPARKIAPALAAGCTTLFKPSEAAPLSGLRLAAILDDVLPAGTVETVVGSAEDVAGVWLFDRRVPGVTFTGSTRVGRLVASQVTGRFVRTVLELGGAAPFIVLDGADLDAAVECLMLAKLRNNGQSCIAANTAWVPSRSLGELAERLEAACADVAIGDPLDEATGLGPTCMPSDPTRLQALAEDARQSGARVVLGGQIPSGEGFFVAPTLCIEPQTGARLMSEEIFGPLLPLIPYTDLDSAVAHINSSSYGLAGYVFGPDRDTARAVAGRLDVGLVGVNTGSPNTPQVPFAPRSDSGIGVEGGHTGLEQFLMFQAVAVS